MASAPNARPQRVSGRGKDGGCAFNARRRGSYRRIPVDCHVCNMPGLVDSAVPGAVKLCIILARSAGSSCSRTVENGNILWIKNFPEISIGGKPRTRRAGCAGIGGSGRGGGAGRMARREEPMTRKRRSGLERRAVHRPAGHPGGNRGQHRSGRSGEDRRHGLGRRRGLHRPSHFTFRAAGDQLASTTIRA